MASPVFTRNQNFKEPSQWKEGYTAPSADGPVMTFENVLNKTIISFGVLVLAACMGWFLPALALSSVLIALVFGMICSFKKEPVPALVLLYAFFEGLALGGVSGVLNAVSPGIVSQAVIGTLCVVAVILTLYKAGVLRTSPKMTKVFLIALLGYTLFSLINVGLVLTGVVNDAWGLQGAVMIPHTSIPLGIVLGILAVVMASYFLVMDFTNVTVGVANRLPERYGWTAAFGIMVTVVWIYLEILKILSLLNRR